MSADVTAGPWDVEVDRAVCIGSGVCAGTVPGLFRIESGRARAVRENGVPADDLIVDAALNCPALAITVRQAGTGTVIAPDDADGG
ncbi:ferredoxin [Actinomadura rayongensis]|uniref:ferredoxin n=1 Tax=Actinomadura rayongensis TaxID=1429076 RepID=UPI001927B8B4